MSVYINDIQKSLKSLDLSSLEGSNILITGATGLIGSCLVDVLMNIGCSVMLMAEIRSVLKSDLVTIGTPTDSFL